MNIVIIEDERPIAEDLSKIIVSVADGTFIKATIQSVEDGVEYFSKSPQVDLIFSDIQLGDGLSFDIFKQTDNHIPIVFCTAFNDYALQAFETMGIDYIVKPFSEEKVANAINKYRLLKQPQVKLPDINEVLRAIKTNMPPQSMPSVILHQGDKIIPLSGDDIALFCFRQRTVFAYTFKGKEFPINQKLDSLETKFTPFFYRTNRQYLVNRKAIESASQHFHRKIRISLKIPYQETILVGKENVTHFLNWLMEH